MSTIDFILLTVCLFALSEAGQDPCVGYEELTEIGRSAQHKAKQSEPNICDRNSIDEAKWYRFTVLSPSRMHDRCAERLRCGTDRPIWLNGNHPTANDPGPKEVQVCSPLGDNCCGWTERIQVKYCRAVVAGDDDFYVYRLKRVPECDMAYCAGDSLVCDQGQVYNPNSKSCTEMYPRLATPNFVGPIIKRRTMKEGGQEYDDFHFACSVELNQDADAATKGQAIEVVFTFDGEEVPSCVPPRIATCVQLTKPPVQQKDCSKIESLLLSNQLRGECLGKSVSCMVRSFWRNLEKQKSHFFRAKQDYFVGIRYSTTNAPGSFTNPPIVLTEGNPPTTLYFESTVPISCPYTEFETTCRITVEVAINDKDSIGVGSCRMLFHGLGAGNKHDTNTVQALPTPGIHNRNPVIRFVPIEANPNHFWHRYKMSDIYIQVIDSSTTYLCWSCGDPHFGTFDQMKFDNYEEGDFILAKSTERNFEVHVRHHKCWAVTCNCAVAVREGNDVLGINACKGPDYRPTLIRYSVDSKSHGAEILNKGNEYTILMPSGAYVKVVAVGNYLNVYVTANTEDLRKMSGFCGNLNGILQDDIPPKGNYRLKPEDSLINANKYPIKCGNTKPPANICSCRGSTQEVPCKSPFISGYQTAAYNTYSVKNCLEEENKDGGNRIQPQRKRRDVGGNETDDEVIEMTISDDEFPIPEIDENYGKNVTLTWPTRSGITEADAVRHCKTKMETSVVYAACRSRLSQKDIDEIVRDCVVDLQITDNVTVAVEYIVDSFQKKCVSDLEKAVNVTHTNETDLLPSESERILQDIVSKICPNQCSGQGDCVNGTCVCKNGFAGDDCTSNTREPPRLSSFRKGTLCDSRKDVCAITAIFAANFYRSKNLICRVTEVNTSRELKFPGSVMSKQELLCGLPLVHRFSDKKQPGKRNAVGLEAAPVYRFSIAVSNDGGDSYSNSLLMTVFDSKCQVCDKAENCVRKNDTCIIDGRCYAAKEISDHDHRLGCIPAKSHDRWTTCLPEDNCGKTNSGYVSVIRSNYLISAAMIMILTAIKH